MKNRFLNWLFGANEETTESENTAFVGTTAELLATMQQEEAARKESEFKKTQQSLDKMWLNVEFLKLAFQIEESKQARNKVFYIDVGNLPKAKAEEYVKALMSKATDAYGDFWLPRREGGRGTEVTTLPPGGATVEGVLTTAAKLKDFASE